MLYISLFSICINFSCSNSLVVLLVGQVANGKRSMPILELYMFVEQDQKQHSLHIPASTVLIQLLIRVLESDHPPLRQLVQF
mmetsp:Transcript_32569/g.40077  ORF Transcript_32569/g.40077 Transcript_32569/m.40077 type:complete len:82 (+) Transcript_32569:1409-1654(+)